MFKDEVIQDIKALGGFPLYGILIVISFLIREVRLSAQLLVGLILAFAVTVLLRIMFFKQRPLKQSFRNFIQKVDASSFPSLHSMRAGVMATLLALFFNNAWFTLVLGLCAVTVAASRVKLKRHFVADVVAGLILGVLVAFASVWLVARFIS